MTQPLKVSTRDFSRGKGGRCVWLTTYHPCTETSRKSGALIYPEPLGPPRLVAGHLYFLLTVRNAYDTHLHLWYQMSAHLIRIFTPHTSYDSVRVIHTPPDLFLQSTSRGFNDCTGPCHPGQLYCCQGSLDAA